MTQTERPTPKFLSFDIKPKVVKIPRSGITPVTVYGTIETTSKNNVNITLTSSKGKVEKSIAPYAKTSTHNVAKFEWKYGIDKDKEVGTYNVRAVLVENTKQIRVGTFRVE